MRDEKTDPSFRTFAETRPKYRSVWFRAYWGVVWFPASVTGVLVQLIPITFAAGWTFLLTAIGETVGGYLFWAPVIIVFVLVLVATIWHTESG